MDHDLVDGSSPPEPGDMVRIRVLREEGGELVVDRPNKDRSLEVKAHEEIVVPGSMGTYEIIGRVNRVMIADSSGPDYFFLEGHRVEKLFDELIELPREDKGPSWEGVDSSDADVDVDVESVLGGEAIEERSKVSNNRSAVSDLDSLSGDFNELLLGKK